VQLVELNIV